MALESLVSAAVREGATDLHLEPGLPPGFRVGGQLLLRGEIVEAALLLAMAREIAGPRLWKQFQEQKSCDVSRTLAGTRCRVNVLRSHRGVGMAIRLFSSSSPTLESLNLHSTLADFAAQDHGLVLVCGPAGSGKSSTLAALIHEINSTRSCHIVTLEQPIEISFTPRRALIRQREVGADTPSFEQGLVDALREDPDVLMVGEMRTPEVMRLTLQAAETGHLVLATLHSAHAAEALQRLVSSFPPENRSAVNSQVADCLRGVIAQRMTFDGRRNLAVPVLEVLRPTNSVRGLILQDQLIKIGNALETGRAEGQWTFRRYAEWLEEKEDWHYPAREGGAPVREAPRPAPATALESGAAVPPPRREESEDVIVIDPPTGSLSDLLSELED